MLELTKYGKLTLEKKGIYLTKTGKPREGPKNVGDVPRAKCLNFEEEMTKVDDQDLQRFGGKIKELTKKVTFGIHEGEQF